MEYCEQIEKLLCDETGSPIKSNHYTLWLTTLSDFAGITRPNKFAQCVIKKFFRMWANYSVFGQ